ncbi:hypothetical protein QYF50_23390 [Paenibacillus vini]|uniref:hypothetical protein n=1 Tax=Paenibacillus vini TaxID=1476024 RepID=UPI0025B6CB20|nr:hypothetical protein [Paenibacillus vini]MDN4070853.1 hypothetical protein [Paenibacillus vini]
MSFSVGFFDRFFGEKVELELPDKNGNVIKRTVSKKWYKKMIQEGKISIIEQTSVRVHMLHPIDGYVILNWIVDKDVPSETVAKFINKQNELFAISVFESGNEKIMVVKEEVFEDAKDKFISV